MTARVVVTGATGNVGTALLRRLRDAGGWAVTGVARRLPTEAVQPYRDADWLAYDLGTATGAGRLATAMSGATAVVHLAWAVNPATSDPSMIRTNRIGTENVLRAAADAGIRHVVCASSVAAYSPTGRWRHVAETWPRAGVPGSAYSRDKAELELRLDRFEAEHPDVTVTRIRPCAVLQRDAGGEFARWLLSPLLPARALGSRWLPAPFWPALRGQAVHADDVAEAIRLILADRSGGAFNLAGDGVLDARQLAAAVGAPMLPTPRALVLAGAWGTWRMGVQPAHPGWLRLADQAPLVDTSRARDTLGWRPRHTASSALTELVAGMRDGAGTASPALAARAAARVRWGHPSHQSQ